MAESCEVLFQSDINHENYAFNPISSPNQCRICANLSLPLINQHEKKPLKPLTAPSDIFKVTGDGNYLFHAFSFVVCCCQKYHRIIRQRITGYMRQIEDYLFPHISKTVQEYLMDSRMCADKVWGTDVEIITAAELFATDIFVYSKFGRQYKWSKVPFKGTVHPEKDTQGAIYIQNVTGVHYDVVVFLTILLKWQISNLSTFLLAMVRSLAIHLKDS